MTQSQLLVQAVACEHVGLEGGCLDISDVATEEEQISAGTQGLGSFDRLLAEVRFLKKRAI